MVLLLLQLLNSSFLLSPCHETVNILFDYHYSHFQQFSSQEALQNGEDIQAEFINMQETVKIHNRIPICSMICLAYFMKTPLLHV